ncbi:MAG: nuclear transport factor 2 family protein [Pyrinomonadaceae bacterium]
MSQENVDIVRGTYEAYSRGDLAAALQSLDPRVEWHQAENFIYADRSPYVGPTAMLEGLFSRFAAEWEGFTTVADELLDAGERVVALGYYSGTYRKTGKPVRAQFAHIWTLRDGKVVKFEQYTDTAQFAQATGV